MRASVKGTGTPLLLSIAMVGLFLYIPEHGLLLDLLIAVVGGPRDLLMTYF